MKFEVVANVYEWNDVSLIGSLYIELDGCPFPERSWEGSVSETLIMWAENLLSLLEAGPGGSEEFSFPDSAYSFSIHQNSASQAMVSLLENAKPQDDSAYEVSFFSVVSAVYFTIDTLIDDSRFDEVQQVRRLKNMTQRLIKASEAHGYHFE